MARLVSVSASGTQIDVNKFVRTTRTSISVSMCDHLVMMMMTNSNKHNRTDSDGHLPFNDQICEGNDVAV